MSKYPRTGEIEKRPRNTSAKCAVCGVVATRRVTVQINWFRGDDVIRWLCPLHKPAEMLATFTLEPTEGTR